MKDKQYSELVKRRFAGYNTGTIMFLLMSIVGWLYPGVNYAPWIGVFFALIITFMNIRAHHRIEREGYDWKQFKVIDHTYLSRLHRKPTGFIALGVNDGEPVRRYHFALTSSMKTPEPGSMLNICIPRDARISEVGRTLYVSDYYGIISNGEPL